MKLKFLPWLIICILFFPSVTLAATSEDLSTKKTKTENGYRIDYVDASGQITLATDKGYASLVRIVEHKEIVQEHFFDENGAPIRVKGYVGWRKEWEDDTCQWMIYVDENDEPVRNKSGYAYIRRSYNAEGKITSEMYFDEEKNAVALSQGQYGKSMDRYDSLGHVIQYSFLDKQGHPMEIKLGYSMVKRTFNELGQVVKEFYYHKDGAPAKLTAGEYGCKHLYDENGKNVGTIYLNENGKAMKTTLGYASIHYERDEWDNVVRYWYYDTKGKPVALSRGQYGMAYEYEETTLIRTYPIDKDGHEIFLFDTYLGQHPLVTMVIALALVCLAIYLPKKMRLLLLLGYIGFIVYMTLMLRESGEEQVEMELFWSYKQFFTSDNLKYEIINNILLFVPFGAIIYLHCPKAWTVTFSFGFSIVIEAMQWFFKLGLCELDDVVSNGIGGWIGIIIVCALQTLRRKIHNGKQKTADV